MRDLFPHPYCIEDADDWIARNGHSSATHFAIEVAGGITGGIGYVPFDGERRMTAEIGYWVGQRFWGHGIATAACGALTRWIFRKTEIERLQAEVYVPNRASQRVLEKCGYEAEGILRRAIVKNGEVLDAIVYAKLRS